MTNNGVSIAFFHSGSQAEKEALEPIADEADKRGYKTRYSTDLSDDPEIGVYNTHVHPDDTVNAEKAVGMVNSVDDGYDGEYFWRERWNRFDIGFLSGEVVCENWQSVSWNRYARPTRGVYDIGWPKSDWVYTDKFEREVKTLSEELELTRGLTALYAPAEESSGKMNDFLTKADGSVEHLLIKHPSSVDYSDVEPDNYESNVVIIDSDRSIFEALGLADILVSDQSSVIPEALHTETIPISVTDWPVNFTVGTQYPGSTLPEFVETTSCNQLGSAIERVCRDDYHLDFKEVRKRHFSNVGRSANIAMDVIEDVVLKDSEHPSCVKPTGDLSDISKRELLYIYTRVNLEKRLSTKAKRRLINMGAGKILMELDNYFIKR